MFYDGNHYTIKKADKALQDAVKAHVSREIDGIDDPLEQYEAMQAATRSLPVVRFMVKHLLPTFTGEVTEENRETFYLAIQMHHLDSMRAHVLEVKAARKWEKEHAHEHA